MTTTEHNTDPIPGSHAAHVDELRRASIALAVSAVRAAEREELTQKAIGLGFEPGVAPQVAALAAEQAKMTTLEPVQFLESMASVKQLEMPTGATKLLSRTNGPTTPQTLRQAACNAYRHAVRVARRAMLRR